MDVICIVGPTAVGKTRLGVELARRLDGEVISGDSMQIYRGMDIGTAKATAEERQGVPHHLLDEKNPGEDYSVALFQQSVRAKITEIKNRGKIPIIVGGTGLYIKAVLYDYEFAQGESRSKAADEEKYGHLDNESLHGLLRGVDPQAAAEIHPNNRKRLMRALEIFEQTGENKSSLIQKQEHKLLYDAVLIGLSDERALLYRRIDDRVDAMMENGLLDEVRALFNAGILEGSQAMRAIGYKELYPYFRGEGDLSVSVDLIKRNSRRYAKRQFTWFKNQMEVNWFQVNVKNFPETVNEIELFIKKAHLQGIQ